MGATKQGTCGEACPTRFKRHPSGTLLAHLGLPRLDRSDGSETLLTGASPRERGQLPEGALSRQTFQTRKDLSATLTLWAQATREVDDECH